MLDPLWQWLIAPAPDLALLGRALAPGVPVAQMAPIAWVGLIASGLAALSARKIRTAQMPGLLALALILSALMLPHLPRAMMAAALALTLGGSRSGGPAALIATAMLWQALFPSGSALMLTIAAFWLGHALFRRSANDNPFSERYRAIRWVPAPKRHAIEQVTQKSGE